MAAAVADLGQAVAALAQALRAAGEETVVRALSERAADLAASLERIAAIGEIEGARSLEMTLPEPLCPESPAV